MSAAVPDGLAEALGAIRAEQSAAVDGLGNEATLWLAAAPMWTTVTAEAAGFPTASVTEFVQQARDVGWCESRGSRRSDAPGELRFWMPDEARREVIGALSERAGTGSLRREARLIAERVLSVDVALPSTLRDWAELMSASAPDRALVDAVRAAVELGDLRRAQQLVAAGEALMPMLAGGTELAVDRARRLVNLGARRRQDGRALGRYLDRPSLSAAVASLLQPDAGQWALQLRGVGGVGKTTLVRYLASGRYAAERGLSPFPVARADFDHISADYPVRRPVQLLLELADELALHTASVTGADRALSSFRATATSAHEALSGLREEHAVTIEHPMVLRAIDDFAQAIERLPGVLLILDTCEELAKADPGNAAGPAVQATLGIIERLHERAKSVRVLLAGRRPLPPRPYLAVQDVAGFAVDEARSYLAAFAARPLAPGLVDAIIRQSAAVDVDVPHSGALPDRVSPFDLALYLSWAEEDPGLDERRMEQAGRGAYVEVRIVDRLRDPAVRRALPALAVLGRCRVDTLASLVDGDGLPAGALVARLAEQEWIDSDGDPPVRLSVKPGLARPLRQYFENPARQAEFSAAATRLATTLGQEVRAQPLGDLDVDEVLAALRLSEPAAAAALWEDIARRAELPPGRWGWVLNVAGRVLGESQEEDWPTADALRAAVSAAYLAASRRADPSFNPRGMWADVRAWSDRHPDKASQRVLRARAALGLLPYTADDQSLWADLRSADPSPALAASAADAADRLLEAGASDAVGRLLREGHLRAALDGEAGGRVQAWARVALGRLWAQENRPEAAHALAEAARALTYSESAAGVAAALSEAVRAAADAARALADAESAAATAGAEPEWADWVPPGNLLARVRIERGLLAFADAAVAALPLEAWQSDAAAGLAGIDGERLASLCLQLRLADGTIEVSEIGFWEELDRYEPARAPTCSAHELVPPLRVTLAEAELAAGRPERALALIEDRRADALSARQAHVDDRTLRLVDAETVRLARRLRLDDQRPTLARLSKLGAADASLLDLQDAARRAMAVVYHEPPPAAGPEVWRRPAGWHTWWQCQTVPPPDLPPAQWLDQPAGSGVELANIDLDLQELRQLGHSAARQLGLELADWLATPHQETTAVRSPDPFLHVRVALRRDALAGRPCRVPPGVPGRRLADAAFEEAELLALRLPLAAARLFECSADAYDLAGDAVGQLMAAACLTDITGGDAERSRLLAAWDRVRRDRPDVAEKLTESGSASGSVSASGSASGSAAGRWSFWATLVQRLLASQPAASQPAAPQSLAPQPEQHGPGFPSQPPPYFSEPAPPAAMGPPLGAGAVVGTALGAMRTAPGAGAVAGTGPMMSPAPPVGSPGIARKGRSRARLVSGVLGAAAGIVSVAAAVALLPAHKALQNGAGRHPTGPVDPVWMILLAVLAVLAVLAGLAVLTGVLVAMMTWIPGVRRLAYGRGVASLRLPSLRFTATIRADPGQTGHVHLVVLPRPLREVPAWQRPGLALVLLAVRLVRRRPAAGYDGELQAGSVEPIRISWAEPMVTRRSRWWQRNETGAAGGDILIESAQAAQPWEHILADSLGPDAVGRIDWVRVLATAAVPFEIDGPTGVAVNAPPAWQADIDGRYRAAATSGREDAEMLRVRHAMGRAVATSAGTRLDVSGEATATSSAAELLDAEQLARGRPALVVLQAEPADEVIDAGLRDDAPERLALAADLIEAGVPAVLALPALRTDLARAAVEMIAAQSAARPGGNARLVRARVRKALGRDVEPSVLDDIVLFRNPGATDE